MIFIYYFIKQFLFKNINIWNKKSQQNLSQSGVINNIQKAIVNFKIEKKLLDPHDCQRHW